MQKAGINNLKALTGADWALDEDRGRLYASVIPREKIMSLEALLGLFKPYGVYPFMHPKPKVLSRQSLFQDPNRIRAGLRVRIS